MKTEMRTTLLPFLALTLTFTLTSAQERRNTTTTATTPVPVTRRPLQDLCDNCTFRYGVGYNPHPSDCTQYIQCRQNAQGVPVVDSVRPCPHGLYWNQRKLTCDFQQNVRCTDDICLANTKLKQSAASCRGFWNCTSGSAVAKCCGQGFAFNPLTSSCQSQPSCIDDCLNDTPHPQYRCIGMRGVPGDRTQYEVQTGPDTWVLMPCASGTAFSTYPCGCTALLDQPIGQVCKPELYLPFNSDTTDQSGRYTWVQNEGVIVKDGKAFFDGRSKLVVPRFSNAWWGATVYIHLRYKRLSGYFGPKQTLVSNGDCELSPSIAVCADNSSVKFFAATTDSHPPANITVPSGTSQGDGWNEVLFKLDDSLLQGHVNDQIAQAQAIGNLETRHCGLVIGGGTACQNFEGVMDDVVVYLCRPYIKQICYYNIFGSVPGGY